PGIVLRRPRQTSEVHDPLLREVRLDVLVDVLGAIVGRKDERQASTLEAHGLEEAHDAAPRDRLPERETEVPPRRRLPQDGRLARRTRGRTARLRRVE